jgi:hypothetical protein
VSGNDAPVLLFGVILIKAKKEDTVMTNKFHMLGFAGSLRTRENS